ncbi:MAG: sulfur carrier protein ThiS [Acidobacteriota bacterium]
MVIIVNGERREVESGTTVAGLITLLELKPERLAVEVNRAIIRRGEWSSTLLAEGDRVEIVNFVGGGETSKNDWMETCQIHSS